MIYKQTIETPSYLCDVDDRLHTWATVRLCQEVTEYHGNMTGIGFKTLMAKNQAWVITRALYNVFRLPNAFEIVELSTWSRGNNGLIAFRDYRMETPDGETLLTGTSYWTLIDMSARHVIRLGDVVDGYENHDILATGKSELQKIKLPDMSQADCTMERPVAFAMLDHTRHVNNSEYIRLVFDMLHHEGFSTDKQFVLELNYQLETHEGETLTAVCKQVANNYYFRIDNQRGISVVARVQTA